MTSLGRIRDGGGGEGRAALSTHWQACVSTLENALPWKYTGGKLNSLHTEIRGEDGA